jgi:hypothetical protein
MLGLVDREPAGLLGAHTAGNPEIKITKKSNVHPAAAANPAATQAQNRSRRGGTAGRGARHVAAIERLAVERLAGLAGLDAGAARHRVRIEDLAADRATGPRSWPAVRHVADPTARWWPLIAAEAVASGGMIDAPPASRRGPWCTESGLTKGLPHPAPWRGWRSRERQTH